MIHRSLMHFVYEIRDELNLYIIRPLAIAIRLLSYHMFAIKHLKLYLSLLMIFSYPLYSTAHIILI